MVKAAIKKANGRIALAATKLDMSSQVLHDRVNKNREPMRMRKLAKHALPRRKLNREAAFSFDIADAVSLPTF